MMKKCFLLLTVLVMSTVSNACPAPTPHFVAYLGPTLNTDGFHEGVTNAKYLGVYCTIGYEDAMRYTITSLQYSYIALGKHQFGVLEAVNLIPMWIGSPINLHVLLGMGDIMTTMQQNNFYGTLGLELSIGQLHCPIQFFIRDEYCFVLNNPNHNYFSCGFKFWLGKDW